MNLGFKKARIETVVGVEGRHFCGFLRGIVVRKLSKREEIGPIVLEVIAMNTKILF